MKHFDGTKRVHKSSLPLSLKERTGFKRAYAILIYYVEPARLEDTPPFAKTIPWDLFELSKEFDRGDVTSGGGSSYSNSRLHAHLVDKYGDFATSGLAYSNALAWCWPHGWGPHDSEIKIIPVKATPPKVVADKRPKTVKTVMYQGRQMKVVV